MRQIAVLLLGLSVAGCGGGVLLNTASQPAPQAYQQLAADYGRTLLELPWEDASISAIQPTSGPQLGDWYACVKEAGGKDYAVFYQGEEVSVLRLAVAIDNCGGMDGYRPLPRPKLPATKPKNVR